MDEALTPDSILSTQKVGKLIENRNKDGVAGGTAESDLPQSGYGNSWQR